MMTPFEPSNHELPFALRLPLFQTQAAKTSRRAPLTTPSSSLVLACAIVGVGLERCAIVCCGLVIVCRALARVVVGLLCSRLGCCNRLLFSRAHFLPHTHFHTHTRAHLFLPCFLHSLPPPTHTHTHTPTGNAEGTIDVWSWAEERKVAELVGHELVIRHLLVTGSKSLRSRARLIGPCG